MIPVFARRQVWLWLETKKPPRAYKPLEASDRHLLEAPPHGFLAEVKLTLVVRFFRPTGNGAKPPVRSVQIKRREI
jgi:hypothetical protein